jgi:hypothetical protein
MTVSSCGSKRGCIDPVSLNFDPDAKIDDQSCTYPAYYLNPVPIRKLKNKFIENSALNYDNERIWTLSDAGGENRIYTIDTLGGGELEDLELLGVTNIDFEALTSNDTHFFVGDFGNNDGIRTDLTIYKFPKPSPIVRNNIVSPESIRFTYPDQKDYRKNQNTSFDCEAMIYYNDHLYLFTKDHQTNTSSLYEIPAQAGSYEAKLKGKFDTKGTITDAHINRDKNKIVLVGHHPDRQTNFLWVLKDFRGSDFFTGKKLYAELGTLDQVGQIEGVSFFDNNRLFISNEQYKTYNPYLYLLNIESVK